MSAQRWYSVPEAAAYFGIKPKTLYSHAARGNLPPEAILHIGTQIRINIAAVEKANAGREIGEPR